MNNVEEKYFTISRSQTDPFGSNLSYFLTCTLLNEMRRWFTRARDDIDCQETRGKETESESVCERERETSDKEEAREGRRIEESKGLKIGGEWGEEHVE